MPIFKLGDVIHDRYEVSALLGEGGTGVVYAARDLERSETVAIKLLLPSHHDSPGAVARFLRQARAGKRIQSAHAARILHVATFQGAPFMVMEHLEGRDLATVLAERGQLRLADAVDFILQACEAVNEAHTLGIVHRNLKPANLFVSPAPGGLGVAKVVDFALDQWSILDDAAIRTSPAVGSPRYVSPEQLTAPWITDPRSDVWSLMVILYEMLAGTHAFGSDSALLCGTYPSLSSVRTDLPAAIDDVLSEALAMDRDARPSSIVALAARLAPLGSDAARALCARIEAERTATPPPPELEPDPPDPGTTVVKLPLAPTPERSPGASIASRARRWVPVAVAGALGVAVGGATLSWVKHGGEQRDATTPRRAPVPPIVGPTVNARLAGLDARCASRDPAACETLAGLFANGEGDDIPVDGIRTHEYERAACDAGSAYSCFVVRLDNELLSAHTDVALSNSLLKEICDKGSMDACALVGAHWAIGAGLSADDREYREKGKLLIKRACHGGVENACRDLVVFGEPDPSVDASDRAPATGDSGIARNVGQ